MTNPPWKWFTAVPGTWWIRFRLLWWEALLGLLCWYGGRWGGWGLLALPLAFVLHELCFRWWVLNVARIKDADDGDIVGVHRAAILTAERWTGPVL